MPETQVTAPDGTKFFSMESAPTTGEGIEVLYEDGTTEADVYWASERYCMLGAPMGSFGAGWVSTEAGNLPVGNGPKIIGWRPEQPVDALKIMEVRDA